MAKPVKYVFVTGGVLSGLGKGITAASMGNILKARGFRVNIQKCDPYLNVDAGMLNPREHGECYVTKDGAETDLDLGHYERFLDEELTSSSSLMSGRVLRKVIEDERQGKYNGDDVQIVPHLTGAIQEYIADASRGFDVHFVEIGGTVGDLESLSFIEAVREFSMRVGRENCVFVHVVYMPYLMASQETKTKPAQNAVRELRGFGIVPDILAARSEVPANPSVKHKLSLFCGVEEEAIVLLPNASTIYEVPLTLEQNGIGEVLCRKLDLPRQKVELAPWRRMVDTATSQHAERCTVGVIAKYLDNQDTYMSVFEALRAAGWAHKTQVDIEWIDAEELGKKSAEAAAAELSKVDGILVPGGFGSRGIEGKIKAATFALENKKPYLGICLGLQMAVIAAARRAGVHKAGTTETSPDTPEPVISTMEGQEGQQNTGGTMRLGDYPCYIVSDSKSAALYGQTKIVERHRHRFECNNAYREQYASWGIRVVGTSPDHTLVEMVEAIDHPFMIASQFHPEFKSRPNRAHPLFSGFIAALQKHKK